MYVRLIVTDGHSSGLTIPVNQPAFVIGRADGCNLRSHSTKVSRRHCTILVNEGAVIVQDLGGENGTFVNGNRIATIQALKDGDKIVVGAHSFVVSIDPAAELPETEKGQFFELSAPPMPQPEQDGANLADATAKTAITSAKPSGQEPEVMFEIRYEGQRVSVTKSRLFAMARKGSIQPDDLVTVAGTKVFADTIHGIVFGGESSPPPPYSPPSPPVLPTHSGQQAQQAAPPVTVPQEGVSAFPDFGEITGGANLFDNVATAPAVRAARRGNAFGTIWKSLDISFSRVYAPEGNDLVIHSMRALYYIVVVSCLLFLIWTWFDAISRCCEEGNENPMATFSRQFPVLAVVTFGLIALVVVVRILLEMLLLAWFESAKHEEQQQEKKK